MNQEKSRQPVPERVGIYGTEDDNLRALGEVLVNDVSRNILKMLRLEILWKPEAHG